MFSVTCDKCGAGMQLDEAAVPPSGIVKKCPNGHNVTVMPPPAGGIGQELDLDGFMPMSPPIGGDPKRPAPPPLPMAKGPAMATFDAQLDENDIVDLPAPKGPSPSPSPSMDVPDLLAPVGPSPTRGITDLPAPVGPVPTKSAMAQLTDAIDLLAPVGPVPTKGPAAGVTDLPTPVGPLPTKGPSALDLLAPVGPVPTKGPAAGIDLPAPVGPLPTKSTPDLLTPVGPTPKKSVDLPAPKGFFDDAPPPRPNPSPSVPPPLELDGLDLSPAAPIAPPAPVGAPPLMPPLPGAGPPKVTSAMPALDLAAPALGVGPDPIGPGGGGFSLDGLDLVAGGEGGKSGPTGGRVSTPPPFDAGNAGTADASVISFKPASASPDLAPPPAMTARAPAARGGGGGGALDLDTGGPALKKGTLAGDAGAEARPSGAQPAQKAKARSKAELSPQARRKRTIVLGAVVLVVALGGAGFYVKQQMDKAKELKTRISAGLVEARKLMASDDLDHWDKAYAAAQKVLRIDGKNADAIGVAAQAQYAAAIDEGQNVEAHRKNGDDMLNKAVQNALDSVEIDKAKALGMLLDDKPGEATATLNAALKQARGDADIQLYLGWAQLAGANPTAAKAAFEQTLARQPDRLPALYGLGRAQLALGDNAGAKATFEKVLGKRTNHVGAWVNLARMLPRDRQGTREKRFLEIVNSEHAKNAHPRDLSLAWALAGDEALRSRRFDDAAERFKKAEALDKDNVEAILGWGFTLLEQKNSAEAATMFEDVLRRDPEHLRATVGLARVFLADGKVDMARDLIGKALAKKADDAEVQLWFGKVLEADPTGASNENAVAAYKKAMELDPAGYEPVIALSQLYQTKMNKPEEAAKVLATLAKDAEGDAFLSNTLGGSYLAAGDAATAEKWFRNALRLEPGNAEARSNLGAALEARGDLPGAIVEYEAARKADPVNENVALRLGAAYQRGKRWADAEKLYLSLLDESSGKKVSLNARAAAGRFYARRGELAKAKPLGEAILAEDAHHPAGLFLKGVGLLAEGQNIEAQKLLSEAVAVDPQPQYFEALGRAYEAQNMLEDAINAYGRAIEKDKMYVEPLLGRARVRQRRREWTEAMLDCEAARQLEPERAEAWWRIGDSLYELGKKKDAVTPYREALARDSKNAEVHFKLGRTYYDIDKPREALASLREAVRLAPPDAEWFPDAVLKLGYTLRAVGSRGEACGMFVKYMEVAPETAAGRGDVKQILLGCP